ncbi:MAG: zinc-binding dehydrogenase, partial [Marinosulfonomonas sp.]|nr:zinc-binding dehydrogenase [Marinosulfonomonas sp.]
GVDVVIDNVGSAVFWECFQSLALHGRYAVVGEVVGKRIEVNLARIFFKRAQLLGVGSVSRVQLADVAALCADGKLHARIDSVLPLEQVAEAHRRVELGLASGRVVLSPNAALDLGKT